MFVAAAAFLFAFLFSRLQPLLFQSSVVSRQQSVVRSQPSATLLPCLRFCFCSCLSCCHSRRESAVPVVSRQQSVVSHAATVVVAFLAVIPAANLLLPFPSSSANPTRDQRKRHRANAPPLHAMLIPEGNLLLPKHFPFGWHAIIPLCAILHSSCISRAPTSIQPHVPKETHRKFRQKMKFP